jgi:tetratricopeptide (TPR) repeat protein
MTKHVFLAALLAATTLNTAAFADEPMAPPAAADATDAKTDAPAAEDKEEKKEDAGEKLFGEGRDALFAGEYGRAIDLFERAVATDPEKNRTSYRLYLARAHRYAGQEDQAGPLLREILAVAPDHVEAGRLLAEIYAKAEKWQEILDVMKPLLKYRHDYPTYHLLAEASYHLDQHDEARRYYRKAIKLNGENARDHYQLGNICLSQNLFARATESYEAALRLGIDSPVLHYKLASAYFNQKNYFGRIRLITVKSGEAGEINGDWYLVEAVAGQEHQFRAAPKNSAIYHVAKAIEDGLDDRPDTHLLRANVYLNARHYQKAYEMFGQLAATVPEDDEALFYFYYAQSAFGVGKFEEYLGLLDKAIERDEEAYGATRVDAYLLVAEQFNQQGDLEKYIEYLGKAVRESPRTASLHLKLGNAYQETQQYPLAVAQWRMVLDLEPEHKQRTQLLNLVEKYHAQ